MSFLIRAIVFLMILWIARRLLAALVRKPPARPQSPDQGGAGNLTVKDPVCGMYMDPRIAVRSGDQYFCSEECLQRYKKSST